MKIMLRILLFLLFTPAVRAQLPPYAGDHHIPRKIERIAFGSCAQQWKDLPILQAAADRKPDLFIFLGDNIYGDTHRMKVLRKKYRMLARKPGFKALRNTCDILATWDDHDYGWNDSGRHYPEKAESREIFLNFWEEPEGSERREREGIYTSYCYEQDGHRLQIILLDLRSFRDDIRPYDGQAVDREKFHYSFDYWPYDSPDSTLLGEAQWAWLDTQLNVPADLRIIGSSTQFGISWNGYEAWANFPHERERMVDLIRDNHAEGVIFLSGDVHYAEFSRFEGENCYPLYDFTSSGISSIWDFACPNTNRISEVVMENHFGWMEIDWATSSLVVKIIDGNGKERLSQQLDFSDLRFD